MEKLEKLNIKGKLLVWIKSFLENRTQKVVVEGASSREEKVLSGVPQGSVLGPLLFLLMINDLPDILKYSRAYSFADDSKIIKPILLVKDYDELSADLTSIYGWTDSNNLEFNTKKFKLMRYISKKNPTPLPDYDYFAPDGTKIEKVNTTVDLGVIMNADLNFKDHINCVYTKCKQDISQILRTFNTRKKLPMLTLWKTLIAPKIDYCSQLWSPTKIGEMQELESLQRTFTSKIKDTEHLGYWERLKSLKMYSIEHRLDRYLIIYSWKIIEKLVVTPEPFSVTDKDTRTGRKYNIVNSYNKDSPFTKAQKMFNKLPKEIRNITGVKVEIFKNHLDKFISKVPDEPNVPGYLKYRPATSNSISDQIKYIPNGGYNVVTKSSNSLAIPRT